MGVKPYKIEDEEPMMLAETMATYGSSAYDEDDIAVLDPEEDLEYDLDNENPEEWDEIMRLGVMVGMEQIKRGQCHTHDEVFGEIYSMLDEYKKTHGWN